jgi:phosphopantothenoylcysteine decarboxylase/phosphopantothenate--cysteine ligase
VANIVLGVSGSVACYRAADLARDLMRQGHTVRACLTDAAQKFVSPVLFESLTGQPCLVDVFDEPERGRMAHIDWARNADAVVIAPATANTIAKLAHGVGDDMLTTIVLASTAPLVIAPAMNPQMYANEAHQLALHTLASRAARIVEPSAGEVACGEQGQGKLATNAEIVAAVMEILAMGNLLRNRRVLLTSGPTQEPIDDVRFLTNRSSGKMGAALARAAHLMGAQVTVIAGPQTAPFPIQADVVNVRTAQQMLEAAFAHAPNADWIIGAAAVADYRPAISASGKLRRSADAMHLELVPNPDIIATLAAEFPTAKVVGFAAEPTEDLTVAREKRVRKGLFAIAVNDVSRPDAGFETDTNELVLVSATGETRSGLRSKLGCAQWLLESLIALENGGPA